MIFKTQAFYFDGQTSASHKTELELDDAARELKFATEDGSVICNSIFKIYYEIYGDKMRVRFKNSEAHIVIEDKSFASELENIMNDKVDEDIFQKLINLKFKFHLLLALSIIPAIVAIYIFAVPFIAEKAVYLIPVSFDAQIGDAFTETFAKTRKIDSAKTAFLNEFASKIEWDNKVDLNFIAIEDSSLVNAFAFPNGSIIVFSGLLDKIEGDSEALSALLAHEVSHVNKRHSMQILCKNLAGYALISILLTDISGLTAVLLENASQLGNLSFSRSMELEADNAAMDLLEKNGISLEGMLRLMNILQSVSGHDYDFLSTHPATKKRMENVLKIRR
jgi:predicted Zn-dependent protease